VSVVSKEIDLYVDVLSLSDFSTFGIIILIIFHCVGTNINLKTVLIMRSILRVISGNALTVSPVISP
jgi:hypothetical protein